MPIHFINNTYAFNDKAEYWTAIPVLIIAGR